jgi:hypothetical protein
MGVMKNAKSTDWNWHDPDDALKLTEGWASEAEAYDGKTLARRGSLNLAKPNAMFCYASIRVQSN